MSSGGQFNTTNRDWIASDAPARGRFIAYLPGGALSDSLKDAVAASPAEQDDPAPGSIEDEVITPVSMRAKASASTSAVLVMKVSYHPNWHVFVDGHEQPAFMVSPSYIGTLLTPGQHQIRAEYRSGRLKKFLMLISFLTLAATVGVSAFGLERRVFRTISSS